MISLPLTTQNQVIGSLVLVRPATVEVSLGFDEFRLAVGIAQQLGLSIENARLYQEARRREKRLAELLRQVVGAQEAERQRIARELHDATGQSLTAIALGLRGVESLLGDEQPQVVDQVREIKQFGTSALGELRQLIADLRPPQLDDLGLVAALQWYIRAFEKRRAIKTSFEVVGEVVRLPSEYEIILFRIIQEALTNIAKHARANQATVRLESSPGRICLAVEDNGIGFEPEKVLAGDNGQPGWGLLGIQERTVLVGGQYEIDSAPGQGTQIRVMVPLIMESENVKDTTVIGG
jgi:signal transduction histidine kinase